MEHDAVEVNNRTKCFGEVQAVDGISFSIHKGELFGFLGSNGAGKTTTINMLTGLARPDSGSIRLCGIDCTQNPRAAQRLIGVVPDESNLYPDLLDSRIYASVQHCMVCERRSAKTRPVVF